MFDFFAASGNGGAIVAVWISIIVLYFVVNGFMYWGVFQKAGYPGWASIVPIWQTIVQLKIAGYSPWLTLLLLVGVGQLVILIMSSIGIARAFGKSGGFAVGLILLGIVFYPMLGYGSASYQGVPETAAL